MTAHDTPDAFEMAASLKTDKDGDSTEGNAGIFAGNR